jgi:hypothetical protein
VKKPKHFFNFLINEIINEKLLLLPIASAVGRTFDTDKVNMDVLNAPPANNTYLKRRSGISWC